jgi:hypothetical protein
LFFRNGGLKNYVLTPPVQIPGENHRSWFRACFAGMGGIDEIGNHPEEIAS